MLEHNVFTVVKQFSHIFKETIRLVRSAFQ